MLFFGRTSANDYKMLPWISPFISDYIDLIALFAIIGNAVFIIPCTITTKVDCKDLTNVVAMLTIISSA